jgi:hypothetical protein
MYARPGHLINIETHKSSRRDIMTEKITNKSILQDIQIEESWQIKQQKMKYFGHIKHHEGLEQKIMEGFIPGRRKMG